MTGNLDPMALLERFSAPAGDLPSVGDLSACGQPVFLGTYDEGKEYCDGEWHRVSAGVTHRCPEKVRQERKARLSSERQRLKGEIALLRVPGFSGFDPLRPSLIGGERALAVMQRFARERPPLFNVVCFGPNGLGKTHLLLASHFELIAGGVASLYVTTPELRRLFKRADNFEPEIAAEAQAKLERLVYAEVVHFDDVGHIENDARARGQFAEGFKDLLDRSRAKWAVSTNRSAQEAESHPDMTGTIVSRLMFDAELVYLSGIDYRAETAARPALHLVPDDDGRSR